MPSLVAAARGAEVTAIDWAADAIELLARNASRNGLAPASRGAPTGGVRGPFDLVLGADLLYEERNVEPLLELLPRLAPEVLLAEPGRPHAADFFGAPAGDWLIDEVADRVYRLT